MKQHAHVGGKRGHRRKPGQGFTKGKGTAIRVAPRLPVIQLQAAYGVDPDRSTCFSAQTREWKEGKALFQRDAWRYAHALGQALAFYGGFVRPVQSKLAA